MASDPVERVHCVIRFLDRVSPSAVRVLRAAASLHSGRGQATREWRCTGSNCLPARGSFLDLALRHFSWRGASSCGNLNLVCLVPCGHVRPVFRRFRHRHRVLWNPSRLQPRRPSWCSASPSNLSMLAWTCGPEDFEQGFRHSHPPASPTWRSHKRAHLPACGCGCPQPN